MKKLIQEAMLERPLLGDGAMGTQLMLAGLEQGNCGEAWNLNHPERVLEIQRRYVEAGSECLITNTFGGSRIMLNRHGQKDNVAGINKAAVAIAREAFGERDGYVLGDIGPFGGLMVPFGEFTEDQVRSAFEEQAAALVEAGADAIIVETQTGLEELRLAIEAAQKAGAPCIIGSMAYDVTLDGLTFRTMMGIDPERAAEFMEEHGAHVVALNCGTGMEMERAREAVLRYKSATSLPVMVQPNAGKPRLENMKVIYDESPEQMVKGLVPLLETGVNVVGACCGSTPDHIRAFRKTMDEYLRSKPQRSPA
ncbi:MAG: homocysteine S-methyltransferase family protein [Terracidiphilus sp.]|jgi:5-methyltetrahydrofolate--homocysteine methyltransferase